MVFESAFRGNIFRYLDLIVIIEHVPADQNIDGNSYVEIGSNQNGTSKSVNQVNIVGKRKGEIANRERI